MKKIISFIIAFILVFSAVSAADLPEFFSNTPLNYTADYDFSVSLENAENIFSLLKELDMPEEVSYFVNMKSLLESLLSTGMKMNLQADMSSDFRRAKIALTADSTQEVIVNQNLEIGVDMKMGMWLDMNLSAETPVFEVIYSHPILNKYMVIDLFETLPDEETKALMLKYFDLLFSKDFMDSVIGFTSELYAKHAEISVSGATCTVKITNDGLIGMMKELIPFMTDTMNELLSAIDDAELSDSFTILSEEETDLSMLDNLKILGEKGITYTYSLLSGKISRGDMKADISIDIESMYAAATGEQWPYESDGKIDIDAQASIKMSKYGSTSPEFPQLTKDNSFSVSDLLEQQSDIEYVDVYTPEYPNFYVWAYAKELPVINGEYYVPLRACLENAYDNTVTLEYNNGVVTAASEYFPGFKTLKLTKDSAIAYTDGKQLSVSKVIIKDGTTYVGTSLFENTFGWELSSIIHYVLDNEYEITYYTTSY